METGTGAEPKAATDPTADSDVATEGENLGKETSEIEKKMSKKEYKKLIQGEVKLNKKIDFEHALTAAEKKAKKEKKKQEKSAKGKEEKQEAPVKPKPVVVDFGLDELDEEDHVPQEIPAAEAVPKEEQKKDKGKKEKAGKQTEKREKPEKQEKTEKAEKKTDKKHEASEMILKPTSPAYESQEAVNETKTKKKGKAKKDTSKSNIKSQHSQVVENTLVKTSSTRLKSTVSFSGQLKKAAQEYASQIFAVPSAERAMEMKRKGSRSTLNVRQSQMSTTRFRSRSKQLGLHKKKSIESYEEYSTSSSSQEIIMEVGQPKEPYKQPKKGKKDKKGKKGKTVEIKEEAEEPEKSEEPSADDFMAEIAKMKAEADRSAGLEEVAPPTAEKTKKKEKKPKEKKEKTPKVKLTEKQIEAMKIEAAKEEAKLAALEELRRKEELVAAIEKEKREIIEQQIRLDQLGSTLRTFARMENYYDEVLEEKRKQEEWEFFLACGYLPSASNVPDLSTYIHLWKQNMTTKTVAEISQRNTEVLQLLDDINSLLDVSAREHPRKIENWKWIQRLLKEHQTQFLDTVTFTLLRDIQRNLHRIDLPTADFDFEDDNIKLSIWCRVQLPIPLPNPRRAPKPRVNINFTQLALEVLLPIEMNTEYMAVRAIYLKFDFKSDTSPTLEMPEGPEALGYDMITAAKKEWHNKLKYKYARRDKKKKPSVVEYDEDMNVIPWVPEREIFESDEDIPNVPYKKLDPTASEYAIALEDVIYSESRNDFLTMLPEDVLNLRKFTILGGLYQLDLLHQPVQPQDQVTMELLMSALYLPKQLEYVTYSVEYVPPEPAGRHTMSQLGPKDLELYTETKKAEAFDKLILITLKWPQHVIFFELPLVFRWDEDRKFWSEAEIYELQYVEDQENGLKFRTTALGTFGFATLRYGCLPYQSWELRPEKDGTMSFSIMTAVFLLEFNIKEDLVCISNVKKPHHAFKGLIGVYLKFYKLQRTLQSIGVDIFPEPDAFCYLEEGTCEKQWPMEHHNYYCMARMSTTFNFAWSRWNKTAGRRSLVMLMREYDPNKTNERLQRSFSTVLITPVRASFITCNEDSEEYSANEIESIKLNSDLYNLMKTAYSITIRKQVDSAPEEMVYVLTKFLRATRVLSFS